MKKRINVTISNLTQEQFSFLSSLAKKSGLTITAMVKTWINRRIEKEQTEK